MDDDERTWLTCKEAAEILGVTKATISRHIAAGRLEAVKVGKRALRIRPAALRSFIAMNTTSVVTTVKLENKNANN